MMKWAGWSPQKRGNNTEAIRGNGGIISLCYIISTDSSFMHNLHRFHNTPRALILGQLSSGCHFVGVSTWMEGKEWMFTRGPPLHLRFHLNCGWWGVFSPESCRQPGEAVRSSSLSSVFLHTLIPFTDQIKAPNDKHTEAGNICSGTQCPSLPILSSVGHYSVAVPTQTTSAAMD